MQTEFDIHHRFESCAKLLIKGFAKLKSFKENRIIENDLADCHDGQHTLVFIIIVVIRRLITLHFLVNVVLH